MKTTVTKNFLSAPAVYSLRRRITACALAIRTAQKQADQASNGSESCLKKVFAANWI